MFYLFFIYQKGDFINHLKNILTHCIEGSMNPVNQAVGYIGPSLVVIESDYQQRSSLC